MATRRRWIAIGLAILAVLAGAFLVLRYTGHWQTAKQLAGLGVMGSSRELRSRAPSAPPRSPEHKELLILALDGVDRSLLYQMLRAGELPELAELLGVDAENKFPHAFFDDTRLSTLPSITMAAWATVFTGTPPAQHGITGNEFFVRETRELVAPAPVSVNAPELTMALYTDDYLGDYLRAPTIYETMRARDPNVLIWVAMSPVYRGADRLIITSRVAIIDAFTSLFAEATEVADEEEDRSEVYAIVDREVIEEVIQELDESTTPDVLTVYLPGTDLYAHVAPEGPELARRRFLAENVDPEIGKLTAALKALGALEERYVVVTSDHGHTEVHYDDVNALAMGTESDPPALLRAIGMRPRPFEIEVDEDDDFDTVLAYQGAMAFVYIADRSTCAQPGTPCDWRRPPRMEDVIRVADAFYRNDRDGSLVSSMRDTLDLVLVREPRPFAEIDNPFQVYIGGGKAVSIEDYLDTTARPDLLAFAERLSELATGPRGERAGDVLLMARYRSTEDSTSRFYFAGKYESWHGSPNRLDSEVPFIVAHPGTTTRALQEAVERATGNRPWQTLIHDVLLALRYQR